MKKYLAVFGTTLLVFAAFLTAALVVRGKEFARFPQSGLYFARTDSYYAYSEKTENPLVTVTCFEVKGGDSLLSYGDFAFLSGGTEYSPLDASILPVFTDAYFTRYTVQAVLDITAFPVGETVSLDGIRLKGKEGTEDFAIGALRIARFAGETPAGLGFSGYTQGAGNFSSYTVGVSNNGMLPVTLSELILPVGGGAETKIADASGTTAPLKDYVLEPGKTVWITATFRGESEFCFNYLKPALRCSVEGKASVFPVGGVSDYVTPMDREAIVRYLGGGAA